VRLVFRNFPLATAHPHAERAAEAAWAQGQFWAMHDTLFDNQNALDEEDLVRYAAAVGLDESQFVADLAGRAYAARVREDFIGGVRSGVKGTPTFFINGRQHDDPFDLDSLLVAIEYEIVDGADHTGRAM
jgi:protein-disulfide isomerase